MLSLSIPSDEEEKARSQRAKKPRTRKPSWSLVASSGVHTRRTLPVLASTQITTTSPASSSLLDNDNEFSMVSVETAAATVSLSTPALPVSVPKAKPKAKKKDPGTEDEAKVHPPQPRAKPFDVRS
ncbi:uncharacterized protein BJ212DRAFT_1490140 [Suillus subaureus]|uniref:Uncharacterized protein n=1 Tax=Suillus subaureus TaxID=48587 RepID=A0A9P7ASN2_9AGAM|nr:uncharacterized protein BJ212DRAFT_1490140 [Suillus subaureus]KAG1794266.1 hypothetical protein BJ212DRAFT_1490140 [Suillus subaureus]